MLSVTDVEDDLKLRASVSLSVRDAIEMESDLPRWRLAWVASTDGAVLCDRIEGLRSGAEVSVVL